jgi:hypothetical protein
MGVGDFYVESVLPLPYWIGIAAITIIAFFVLRKLDEDRRSVTLFIIIAIILIVAFRIAFPLMFTTISAYEPDVVHYMSITSNWVSSGVQFGQAGDYEHDYPLAFLIGYGIIKLGFPIEDFFKVMPFIVYILDMIILYFIVREISPGRKKIAAVSTFLFSFSSLGYWVAVHYCPDLIGSLFFSISLLLSIKLAKSDNWSPKILVPALLSIIALVLSHHLSTLYFVLAMIGLAFSTWFFKSTQFRRRGLSFLLIGIFTYTFWFAYGSLVYPEFFNVYNYFSGYGSTTGLVQQAGFFNNATFLFYPAFIFGLFALQLLILIKIKSPKNLLKIRAKIREIRINESENTALVFAVGFIFVLGLFFIGFALPVSFPTRVLEVLCIGMYPLASITFLKFNETNSKKWLLIFLIILLFIVLTGEHRYYSQIQRRVIIRD